MSANSAASLGFGLVGAYFGGPFGFAIGSMVGGALFPEQLPDINQKKLGDLRITTSQYGNTIPIVYGTVRIATTLMWTSGRKATKHKDEQGGKGGPSQTTTYYTYSLDGAFAICEGEITGVKRIWINGRLMWDSSTAENSLNMQGSGLFATVGGTAQLADAINIYNGDETQEPSSLQESYKGVGAVPAYRGLAYIEFENLQLEQFGNGMVNVEVEVTATGTANAPPNILHTTDTDWNLYTTVGGSVGAMEEGTIVTLENYNSLNNYEADVTITRSDLRWNVIERNIYPIRLPTTGSGTNPGFCVNDPYFIWHANVQEFGTRGDLYWFRYPAGPLGAYRIGTIQYPTDQRLGPYGVKDYDYYASGTNRYKTLRFGNKYYFTMTQYSPNDHVLLRYNIDPITLAPTLINSGGARLILDDRWTASNKTSQGATTTIWPDMKGDNQYFFCYANFPLDPNHAELLTMMDEDMNIITRWDLTAYPHGAITGMFWSSDGYMMRKSTTTSGTVNLYQFDPFTDNSTFTLIGSVSVDNSSSYPQLVPLSNTWIMARKELLTIDEVITTDVANISDIVEDQLARVNITSTEVDTTGLTKQVGGYFIANNTSARGSIETLQPIGFFDVAEVDGKLVCRERGESVDKVIPQDDLAARIESGDVDDLEVARRGELELPRAISVTYLNPDDNYETNTQVAERPTVSGDGKQNAQLPVVLEDEVAMTVADTMLYSHYAERESVKFTLSTKHLDVAPNDVLQVGDSGYRIRVTNVQNDIVGVIHVEGTIEATPQIYQSVRDVAYVSTTSEVHTFVGPTIYKIIDVPMLRNVDNSLGYYVAAYGVFSGWKGANLYHSNDNTSYSEVDAFTIESDFGYVSTAFATTTECGTWDWSQEIEVRFSSSAVVLSTDTEANVLGGANAALVGRQNGDWEVIQWVNASATADNTYMLSQLLRGRRGTEHAINTHEPFPLFIPIADDGSIKFIQDDLEHLDTQIYYKGVSLGNYVQNADPITFTNEGKTLMPRAPCRVRGEILSGNNKSFTWEWVSRLEYTATYVAVSAETSTNFEVDFYDSASTLLRTVSAITDTSVAYTSADRVADGASANELIICNVFQISDVVGRGFPGTTSI